MRKKSIKKCLITGANGLVGSQFVKNFNSDYEIFAISRSHRKRKNNKNVYWYNLDLSKEIDDSALPEQLDAVIYLAQSEHFRDFPQHALDIFHVNTMGLLCMLEYARKSGVKTFVYASSGGVYGTGEREMKEDLKIPARGDLGFYLSSKLCSEIIAENYISYMNIIILRLFFVYGIGQKKNMLIPRLIDSVKQNRAIILKGKEGIKINPIYVSDAAMAIKHALDLPGSYKINIAGPKVLSLREIAEIIGNKIGQKPLFDVRDDEEPNNIIGDATKMAHLLGPPVVQFVDGISYVLGESG